MIQPVFLLLACCLIPAAVQAAGAEDLFTEIEKQYHIPPHLSYAIALAESGRTKEGRLIPWPWTLNVEGKGHYFNSRREAEKFIDKTLKSGKNFDGGYMQQSWRWQKHRYQHPYETLDPRINIVRGIETLLEWYQKTGSWVEAIGHYHAGDINSEEKLKRARNYIYRVWGFHDALLARSR
jgi:soluble lytic murein transglycosylase-like protein